MTTYIKTVFEFDSPGEEDEAARFRSEIKPDEWKMVCTSIRISFIKEISYFTKVGEQNETN